MNHKLDNGIKIWKGNGNTDTLLFSLKGLEILHQKRKGQMKTMVMEYFNRILFHKSGPDAKHIPINQSTKSMFGWIGLVLPGIMALSGQAEDVSIKMKDLRKSFLSKSK